MTNSISRDFYQYGLDGIGINRASEIRSAERTRAGISIALRAPGRPSAIRRWLGTVLIAAGTGIAGRNATARLLEAGPALPVIGSGTTQ
jgi:hypothetical protein